MNTVDDEKSTSPLSPNRRRVFKARRYGNLQKAMDPNDIKFMQHVNYQNQDKTFKEMTNNQYMQYQDQSMPTRMKRKRKFDEFSSGSNVNLGHMLQSADTFRVPFHSLFYVRSNNEHSSNVQMQNDTNENEQQSPSRSRITFNAFQLMMNARNKNNHNGSYNDNEHMHNYDEDDEEMKENVDEKATNGGNIFYPSKEECSITRNVRVQSVWVAAHKSLDSVSFDSNAKIHEYQICASSGVMLVNLDTIKNKIVDLREHTEDVEKWVIDNRYSGFIFDGIFHFFQPHFYWQLIDDNKQKKIKQTLISDMFSSKAVKPKRSTWKCQF